VPTKNLFGMFHGFHTDKNSITFSYLVQVLSGLRHFEHRLETALESARSNRLVPSIRWELLREGMEDYEYLWLVNDGPPQIGVANTADAAASQFIDSRTRFSRVPTDLMAARAELAVLLAPLFADGFESGDTAAWSSAIP
jgi:hypothetical protein